MTTLSQSLDPPARHRWIRWLEFVLIVVLAYSLLLVVAGTVAGSLFSLLGFGPPDAIDTAQRVLLYHRPYHHQLREAIAAAKAQFGHAIVWDCHSIRRRVPRLFDGPLPDLNIGTFDGASCDVSYQQLVDNLARSSGFSPVLNGRFKGGWITRHYGQPAENVHAIQMEIAQETYLTAESAPWAFDAEKAKPLQTVLKNMLERIIKSRPS